MTRDMYVTVGPDGLYLSLFFRSCLSLSIIAFSLYIANKHHVTSKFNRTIIISQRSRSKTLFWDFSFFPFPASTLRLIPSRNPVSAQLPHNSTYSNHDFENLSLQGLMTLGDDNSGVLMPHVSRSCMCQWRSIDSETFMRHEAVAKSGERRERVQAPRLESKQ